MKTCFYFKRTNQLLCTHTTVFPERFLWMNRERW